MESSSASAMQPQQQHPGLSTSLEMLASSLPTNAVGTHLQQGCLQTEDFETLFSQGRLLNPNFGAACFPQNRLPGTDFGAHFPQAVVQLQHASNQLITCKAEKEVDDGGSCSSFSWQRSFSTAHSDQCASCDSSIAALNDVRERLAQALDNSNPSYASFPSIGNGPHTRFPTIANSLQNPSAAALRAKEATQDAEATLATRVEQEMQPRQARRRKNKCVTSPRQSDIAPDKAASGTYTTLLVGNLPLRYTLQEVVTELEDIGLQSSFDFVYLQTGRKKSNNRGYFFVNFLSHTLALRGWNVLQSHAWPLHRSQDRRQFGAASCNSQGMFAQKQLPQLQFPRLQVASVRWAQIQGFKENVHSRMNAFARTPTVQRNIWTQLHGYDRLPLVEPTEECTVNTLDSLVDL